LHQKFVEHLSFLSKHLGHLDSMATL